MDVGDSFWIVHVFGAVRRGCGWVELIRVPVHPVDSGWWIVAEFSELDGRIS